VAFEQASIRVEQVKEFEELKGAIERAFRPEQVEGFLKKLKSRGIRIRDLDSALAQKLLDGGSASAQALYQSLTLSDQAQMREFYLSRIEEIEPALRARFKKLYQYY
jgi:hypothetical protein